MANTLKLGAGKWATGTDTVLAFNDENNNFKPLPFSFSRASSATVVNQSGLIETVGSGEPRIDFKDNAKGALLLEPTRSNIFDYSSNLNAWSKLNSTVTESNVLSLDGVNNSYGYERTSSSSSYIYRIVSLSNTTQYTLSFFVKSGTSTLVRTDVWDTAQSTQGSIEVNLVTKAVSNFVGNSYKIEDYTNGWMRISVTFTSESSFGTTFNRYFNADSVGSELYIWGAQLEVGSYSTSIIPTSGSAVTRVADACNNENLNVDYSGDYTLYLEHETLSITEYNQFQFRQETSISYIFRVGNSINVGSGLYSATNTIGFNKFALSVGSDGSYSFYKNGSLLSSGSGLNANLETLKGDAAGMSIKDIKLYNTRLSNAELQALTTI